MKIDAKTWCSLYRSRIKEHKKRDKMTIAEGFVINFLSITLSFIQWHVCKIHLHSSIPNKKTLSATSGLLCLSNKNGTVDRNNQCSFYIIIMQNNFRLSFCYFSCVQIWWR